MLERDSKSSMHLNGKVMWFQNGQRVAVKLRVASIGRLSIARLVQKMFNVHSRTLEKSITFAHLPAIVNGI